MRMQLIPELGMQQEQQQRFQLNLAGPGLDWLDGSPESLEVLLTTHPQHEDDTLHYLVGGGWAVELLTGQEREHHDLDVINLTRIPFSWTIDEQKPTRYFNTISMPAQKMLDNYTTSVEWLPPSAKSEDEQLTVYLTAPTHLLISKIAGFLREPRTKDYEDIDALAHIIKCNQQTKSKLADIFHHIIGMHRKFPENDRLFEDLGQSVTNEYSTHHMAAQYLLEIIENYQHDRKELARNQVARFHTTLKNIYKKGLEGTVTAANLGIREGICETAWSKNQVEGFWVGRDDQTSLQLLPDSKKMRFLKYWAKAEKELETEIASLIPFPYDQKSALYIGESKVNHGKDFALMTRRGKVLGQYWRVDVLEDCIIRTQQFSPPYEIFTKKGKLIGKLNNLPTDQAGLSPFANVLGSFLAEEKYKEFKTIEDLPESPENVCNITKWNQYSTLLGELNFGKAQRLNQFFDLDDGGQAYIVYSRQVDREEFEKARAVADEELFDVKHKNEKEIKGIAAVIAKQLTGKYNSAKKIEKELRIIGFLRSVGVNNEASISSQCMDVYVRVLQHETSFGGKINPEPILAMLQSINLSREEATQANTSYYNQEIKVLRDAPHLSDAINEAKRCYFAVTYLQVDPTPEEKIYIYQGTQAPELLMGLDPLQVEEAFVKNPEYFHVGHLLALPIMINDEIRKAALWKYNRWHDPTLSSEVLTEELGCSAREMGLAEWSVIEEKYLDPGVSGQYRTGNDHIEKLKSKEYLDPREVDDLVEKKVRIFAQEHKYRHAAYAARDILKDKPRAQIYARALIESGTDNAVNTKLRTAFNLKD